MLVCSVTRGIPRSREAQSSGGAGVSRALRACAGVSENARSRPVEPAPARRRPRLPTAPDCPLAACLAARCSAYSARRSACGGPWTGLACGPCRRLAVRPFAHVQDAHHHEPEGGHDLERRATERQEDQHAREACRGSPSTAEADRRASAPNTSRSSPPSATVPPTGPDTR